MSRLRHAVLSSVLLALITSSSDAQQTVMKDPDLARQYSFYFPGAGHLYTGEYVRGGAMLGIALYAGQQAGKSFSGVCGSTNKSDYTYSGTCPAGGPWLWLGIMAVPYVYGILDARASADRVNAKKDESAVVQTIAACWCGYSRKTATRSVHTNSLTGPPDHAYSTDTRLVAARWRQYSLAHRVRLRRHCGGSARVTGNK